MSRRLPPPGQWFWLPRSSIDVIAAIGPTAFAVLATITSHADENGIAYPSICRMAARLGMHRSTVQRAIQTLINAKLIEAVGRCDSTGAQTSYSFKILPPEIPVAIGAHPPVANEDQGCSKPSPPPGLQMLRPPVANGAHELDPLLTRSNKQEKEPASPASVSAKSTFDEWWKVFPKKAAKPKAAAAYRAALKAIVKDSEIVCDDPAE